MTIAWWGWLIVAYFAVAFVFYAVTKAVCIYFEKLGDIRLATAEKVLYWAVWFVNPPYNIIKWIISLIKKDK